MCGLVGIIGNNLEVGPVILQALKRLEYRGYDSAGMAICNNGRLQLKKGVGKLEDVERKCQMSAMPGMAGIGHVRWATHGAITVENAHPFADCHERLAVVHNGIIENHNELRSQLSKKHTFSSDTDSEVISHLIEEGLEGGASLEEAVSQATRQLKGSYAFLVIFAQEQNKIVGARRDSPLVVGLGNGRNFVASDPLCFIDDTNKVLNIEDDELVIIEAESVKVIDKEGNPVKRDINETPWQWSASAKKGFKFFMLKEIFEQPQAIRKALIQDRNLLVDMAMTILRSPNVIFTACGTSRHAALIGRYAFSRIGGKFSDVILGSEFEYFSDAVDKNTLVIAVSQSGETADVITGVKKAKESGATVFSIVNVVGSSLTRMSDKSLYLNCGPEIGVAATKSFMGQLIVLYLLAFAMGNRLDEGIEKMRDISYLVDKNIRDNNERISKLADKLKNREDLYYIARGINFAIAGEGALKLKEVAYAHAEGMPAGELKHGTLALIESGTPVVTICPSDYTFQSTVSNASEAKVRGGLIIGVSDKEDPIFDEWIPVPPVDEIFYPLVTVIGLQLFAYRYAVARGLDPDMPRNLAKSVTVK